MVAGCGSRGGSDSSGDSAGTTAAIQGPANAKPDPAAKPAQDPLRPLVAVETSVGRVTLELDAEKAPLTVANFLDYVQSGFYNGTIFHLVAKGDVALGGGFTDDLQEKTPRPPVRNEAHKALKNTRGTIAMVRRPDATDSATSQFFFNLNDNPRLDFQDQTAEKYGYCAFGRVVAGQEVLDKIGAVEVEDTPDFPMKPVKTVLINSMTRLR